MSEKTKFLKALKANEEGLDTSVIEQLVMRVDKLEEQAKARQEQINMLKYQLEQYKRNRNILR